MRALGIRDAYKLYRQENKDHKDLLTFLLVAEGFNQFLFDKLFNGEEIMLFERLGNMSLRGKKVNPRINEDGLIKGLAPNWKATNELWSNNPEAKARKELVFYFNEHSEGVRYRFHWCKQRVYIKFKEFYTFKLTRANRIAFKNVINSGKEYVVDL